MHHGPVGETYGGRLLGGGWLSDQGREVLSLQISSIRSETADAATVTFHDPEGRVGGEAGQYVIVRVMISGEEHRRVFSLSSTPELSTDPSITVKRLPCGLVSTYLVERAKPGELLGLEPAAGSFGVGLASGNRRTYYAFAAGSGIVPVMSILRGVLEVEPGSVIYLAYGNRRPSDVIFGDELARLAEAHPNRLTVYHVLSEHGDRIDHRLVDHILVSHPPSTADVWYLVCGPPGMNRTVEARLVTLGVLEDRLKVEHYVPPSRGGGPEPYQAAILRVEGLEEPGYVGAGEVLLSVLDRMAAPIFYACRSGVCGTCKARLVSGRVDPGVPFALTTREQEAGVILTCVSRALSPEVVLRSLP